MDQLLTFLDNFRVGTTIGILISAGSCCIIAYRYYKKVKLKYKKHIEEELKKEQKEKDQEDDLESVKENMNKFLNHVDESHEELLRGIKGEINELRGMIECTDRKVNLLIETDKETIRAHIVQQHRKAVEEQGISLIDLHTLERLCEKYQEEIQEPDEFIEKLIYEIRHLPTKT